VPLAELQQAVEDPLVVAAAELVLSYQPGDGASVEHISQRSPGRVAPLHLLAQRLAHPAVVGSREALLRAGERARGHQVANRTAIEPLAHPAPHPHPSWDALDEAHQLEVQEG